MRRFDPDTVQNGHIYSSILVVIKDYECVLRRIVTLIP